MKPKFFLLTKLHENVLIAKYLISVPAALKIPVNSMLKIALNFQNKTELLKLKRLVVMLDLRVN